MMEIAIKYCFADEGVVPYTYIQINRSCLFIVNTYYEAHNFMLNEIITNEPYCVIQIITTQIFTTSDLFEN